MNTFFDKVSGDPAGSDNLKNPKEIIDEFFYTFHPVESQETLRELLRIISDRTIAITESEKEDIEYFFERLGELLDASYSLRS
jgi:hypothetical protein